MKLEYTLTLDDYKAAWRLHKRQKLSRRFLPFIWPMLFAVSFAGMIYFGDGRHPALSAQLAGLSAGTLVITVGLPIRRFFNVRRSYRLHFPKGHANRVSTLEIDDQQIVRELANVNQLKVLWQAVFAFAQDEKIALIYTNKSCFLMIPTEIMTPAQRTELNDLVARHVTARKP
ncbi:MAG: YcxB family protein [Acidobacteriota bacterium]|nr:YcxB family protein [Acidobacteriota bacterium]